MIVSGSGSQVGDTEGKVLMTTGLLSLAALLFLPCVLAHEASRPKPLTLLPSFAVSCLLIGFSLGVYLVWADPAGGTLDKVPWSFGIAAVWLTSACSRSCACVAACSGSRSPQCSPQPP